MRSRSRAVPSRPRARDRPSTGQQAGKSRSAPSDHAQAGELQRLYREARIQSRMAASIKIAEDPQTFGLSEQAGREARLIVTDESHHAYVAIELIKRIPGFSGLPPL